jgi:hypothetical protein
MCLFGVPFLCISFVLYFVFVFLMLALHLALVVLSLHVDKR